MHSPATGTGSSCPPASRCSLLTPPTRLSSKQRPSASTLSCSPTPPTAPHEELEKVDFGEVMPVLEVIKCHDIAIVLLTHFESPRRRSSTTRNWASSNSGAAANSSSVGIKNSELDVEAELHHVP